MQRSCKAHNSPYIYSPPTCIPILPPIPSHNSTIEYSSATKRHENPKLHASSLKPSLRLRSLAQARVSRSGESSPPRREFANLEQGPPHVLAQARLASLGRDARLLETERVAQATICARRPGRASARLAWASLTVIATAMPATVETYTNQQQHQPFQAISTTYKFKNHKVYLKKVHKHNNNEVLASRTWKWVRAGLDTGPQSTAVRETDRELAEQWNSRENRVIN